MPANTELPDDLEIHDFLEGTLGSLLRRCKATIISQGGEIDRLNAKIKPKKRTKKA